MLGIVACRAKYAGQVDAEMGIEILVLGRKERLDHHGRNGFDRLEQSPFTREFGEQHAVCGMHARRHRRLIVHQHRIVGQIVVEQRYVVGNAAQNNQARKNGKAKQPA